VECWDEAYEIREGKEKDKEDLMNITKMVEVRRTRVCEKYAV
jgi:hypothetical protein